MKYYKVVCMRYDEKVSVGSSIHGQCLRYNIDYWTTPKIKHSKLFVFNNINSAKTFANTYLGVGLTYVYECEVKNPQKLKVIVSPFTHRLEDVWKLWKNKKKYSHLLSWELPKGTVHVDAVKLIKRVD